MRFPKSVPVLTAKDMCIGPCSDGNRHCIAAWTEIIFKELEWEDISEAYTKVTTDFGLDRGYTNYTHVGKVSTRKAAKIFNRFTALLGYVNNNPEGDLKPLRKRDKIQ